MDLTATAHLMFDCCDRIHSQAPLDHVDRHPVAIVDAEEDGEDDERDEVVGAVPEEGPPGEHQEVFGKHGAQPLHLLLRRVHALARARPLVGGAPESHGDNFSVGVSVGRDEALVT